MFTDTATKFPGKISDLQTGAAGVDFSGVTRVVPIILLYERVYFESILREFARRQFKKEGRAPVEDYHLIDVDDLETLTAWNSSFPIKQILMQRTADPLAATKDMGQFLYDFAIANGLTYEQPLLAEVQNTIMDGYTEGLVPGDPQSLGTS